MHTSTEKGFVLVYALVIMIAVMTVSATILTIYIKELKLSGIGRESVIAYYAAESGAECAFYWFSKGAKFDQTGVIGYEDLDGLASTTPTPVDAECMGEHIDADSGSLPTGTFLWEAVPGDNTQPCAEVTVTPNDPSAGGKTSIRSRGYNVCGTANLRVERGFEILY
jgi:Tfp pilus assembly protein PilX